MQHFHINMNLFIGVVDLNLKDRLYCIAKLMYKYRQNDYKCLFDFYVSIVLSLWEYVFEF